MSLPDSAIAGTTITWTQPVTVEGAVAKMVFNHFKTGKTFSVEGEESGNLWTFTLAAVETSNVPTGLYSTALVIESASGRTQTNGASFRLTPAIDKELEETHAAKMVRLLESHLEGRIDDNQGRGLETYTIAGVPITKITHLEARALLKEYRQDVRAEEQQRKASMGLGTGRTIKIEF